MDMLRGCIPLALWGLNRGTSSRLNPFVPLEEIREVQLCFWIRALSVDKWLPIQVLCLVGSKCPRGSECRHSVSFCHLHSCATSTKESRDRTQGCCIPSLQPLQVSRWRKTWCDSIKVTSGSFITEEPSKFVMFV